MMRRSPARRTHALSALVAVFLWPVQAHAHLVSTGMGPVYDGVSHVLLSPDDLVPLLAMGILAGLNGPTAGRRALFTLPAAWLLAGLAAHQLEVRAFSAAAAVVSFLSLGILIAVDRRLSSAAVTAIAAALGIAHGWQNGAGLVSAGQGLAVLAGIGAVVFVGVALVAALVVSVRAIWLRIALRVAGSWVTAIGLLMLGWALRAAG